MRKLIVLCLILISCNSIQENKLHLAKSPYLLQHKDNPVWWQQWGEEAHKAARDDNKLIFLSIGYSSCHWCHVMENETFADAEVAKQLNRSFISIKVDREERPDVDSIYMKAMQSMGLGGGWPLNVFLTPQLKPLWGGTYFAKDNFKKVLTKVSNEWRSQEANMRKSSNKIALALSKIEVQKAAPVKDDIFVKAFNQMDESFDHNFGGFGKGVKFPPSMKLRVMMRIARRSSSKKVKKKIMQMVEKTLVQMYSGGMYDHIGGGFHRYSTDRHWIVPHFEKMLYDNALLSMVYLEAYQITNNKLYKAIAKDIFRFMEKTMRAPKGAFYAALDADSEGVEGKYYVWKHDELKKILTPSEFKRSKELYTVKEEGEFEGANILALTSLDKVYEAFREKNKYLNLKILKYRDKRVSPFLDKKIILAWNALMIKSYAKAYQVLGDRIYLTSAIHNAEFLLTELEKKGELSRYYLDGAHGEGQLDDYAYFVDGLISIYESTFEKRWLKMAIKIQQKQDQLFYSSEKKSYYSAMESKDLFFRPMNYNDNARPNSNAQSLLNNLKLASLTYDQSYSAKANEMIEHLPMSFFEYPTGYAQLLLAIDYYLDTNKEVAIISKDKNNSFLKYLYKRFIPNRVIALGFAEKFPLLLKDKLKIDNEDTAYVCENKVCKKPVNSLREFRTQLRSMSEINFD